MTLRAYWWNRFPNFGDQLTPLLLQAFGHEVERGEPFEADVCCVGSVLEVLGTNYAGTIIGSGFISHGAPHPLPRARILALRGPLSAARAGVARVAFGDPGLLVPMLVEPPARPQTRIGLVPHFKDKQNPAVLALVASGVAKFIDVQAEPLDVLREIADCECVLSSSLHGVVAADAFGRRSAWLVISDAVIGEGFKFRDYGASIGVAVHSQVLHGDENADELASLTEWKSFDRAVVARDLKAAFSAL